MFIFLGQLSLEVARRYNQTPSSRPVLYSVHYDSQFTHHTPQNKICNVASAESWQNHNKICIKTVAKLSCRQVIRENARIQADIVKKLRFF